jgi:carbon storage regulator
MLIVSRKVNEEVVIGREGNIVVKVISISRNVIRLGIEAPEDIPILRRELLDREPNKGEENAADR